jgi:molecular chaperone GrpE
MSDEKTPAAPTAGGHPNAAPGAAATPRPESVDQDQPPHADDGGITIGQLRAIIEVLQGDLDEARRTVEARDAQLEAANEKVLRGFADIENMRKRVEREKEEIAKYAITKLARDVVTVADNFERAIASVPADAKENNPALTSLLEGVTLTEREFLNTLDRHGVKRIAPLGEPFNPHQHQAVMEQAKPDVPAGTVLQVFQVGYLIEDRVLRPAMVVVATGGAKPAKPSNAAPQQPIDEDGDDGM